MYRGILKLTSIIGIFVLTGCISNDRHKPVPARSLVKDELTIATIDSFLDSHHVGEAGKSIDLLLEKDNKNAVLYLRRGYLFDQLDLKEHAKRDFLNALSLGAPRDTAFFNIALTFYEQTNYEACLLYLDSCLSINNFFANAVQLKYKVQTNAGADNYKSAKAVNIALNEIDSLLTNPNNWYAVSVAIDKMLQKDDRDGELHFKRAHLFYQFGWPEAAKGAYMTAINLNYKKADAFFGIAKMLGVQGNYKSGLNYLDSCTVIDRDYAGANNLRSDFERQNPK
jgi:lipoprotein NlpI